MYVSVRNSPAVVPCAMKVNEASDVMFSLPAVTCTYLMYRRREQASGSNLKAATPRHAWRHCPTRDELGNGYGPRPTINPASSPAWCESFVPRGTYMYGAS